MAFAYEHIQIPRAFLVFLKDEDAITWDSQQDQMSHFLQDISFLFLKGVIWTNCYGAIT